MVCGKEHRIGYFQCHSPLPMNLMVYNLGDSNKAQNHYQNKRQDNNYLSYMVNAYCIMLFYY